MENSDLDSENITKIFFWHDPEKRSIFFQAAALCLILGAGYFLFNNTVKNLERQAIATGFGFLGKEAAFEIGESLISYSAADTYARALAVGVLNTLKVSFIGIILTVLLGTLIGIARLSTNWLVSKLAAVYIEVLQDIPVLLQLFFWYTVFYDVLPSPKQALNPFTGLFLSNRGLIFAVPQSHPVHSYMLAAFISACVLVWLIRLWAKKRQEKTGKPFPVFRVSLLVLILAPFIVWILGGAPAKMNMPELKGFNFQGGMIVTPEFSALLLGLVLYTAAFVAEIVRAGIQSVSRGQTEAAMSIGLKPGHILNLVILPQALRVIIPPLTSQMLNLTKNSSLGVAIGFPDFVSVANTSINQTGQAIEGVAMIMAVYLFFSLTTSIFMNWYNKKSKLVER
ncbi:General L-amino acid transport system permease protein [Desulfonema limicola]|uniref:General L-amino acid transport system permease protein n=1 Tax=Desulfonema limicola TaxID=45656 RepID=A0A975B3L8_9BACT|nr:amino acid ABC transporter permease [Desulfonema limicola]QTA78156.1 General L-amino acid transport system permease protein [Desulfonema limicola]